MPAARPGFPLAYPCVRPSLHKFGTEEQKQRFLPGMYKGDVFWCQGYSEPGSGV